MVPPSAKQRYRLLDAYSPLGYLCRGAHPLRAKSVNKGDFARAMRGGIPSHAVDGTSLIALPDQGPRNEPSNQPNGGK
jgi:hypothetical protein